VSRRIKVLACPETIHSLGTDGEGNLSNLLITVYLENSCCDAFDLWFKCKGFVTVHVDHTGISQLFWNTFD